MLYLDNRSEEKVKAGMKNAGSLEEGKKMFDEVHYHSSSSYPDHHAKSFKQVKHWKAESEAIKTVLDNGNASAQKMTTHGEVSDTDPAFTKHVFVASRLTRCMLLTSRGGRPSTTPSRNGSKRWRLSSKCGKTKQVNYF